MLVALTKKRFCTIIVVGFVTDGHKYGGESVSRLACGSSNASPCS